MSIILTWNNIGTFKKNNDNNVYTFYKKPELSFNYDVLLYEPEFLNSFLIYNNEQINLTDQQILEIENFVTNYDLTLKHCINEFGVYVGQHPDLGNFTIVPSAPPTSENWVYINDTWVYVHGVDATGHYMGNVPAQLCHTIATSAPSGFLTLWDDTNKVWLDERTEEQKRIDNLRAINAQRDIALSNGFMYNGNIFHCDPIFQLQVQAYLLAWREGILSDTSTVPIRRKDNVIIQMTKTEVLDLATALMAHVQGVYMQSWAAKDAL
jgi:hypothetical protein